MDNSDRAFSRPERLDARHGPHLHDPDRSHPALTARAELEPSIEARSASAQATRGDPRTASDRDEGTDRGPRICFGSRKLFDAQHHLADNGLDDHKDWRRAWYAARSAQFFIEGAAQSPSGNPFARLTSLEDGNFQLELRLPETLQAGLRACDFSGDQLGQVAQTRRTSGSTWWSRAGRRRRLIGHRAVTIARPARVRARAGQGGPKGRDLFGI